MGFILAFLRGLLPRVLPWLQRLLPTSAGVLFGLKAAAFAGVLAVMPLPDGVADIPAKLAQLPPAFLWFASLVELRFGLAVVLAALVTRFIHRRLLRALEAAS